MKIFCFINSGHGTEFQHVLALAEDGRCLAGHLSSNKNWAKHDIGLTSNWKHDRYEEACPDGFTLEWVDNLLEHEGVKAAYVLNQERFVKEAIGETP